MSFQKNFADLSLNDFVFAKPLFEQVVLRSRFSQFLSQNLIFSLQKRRANRDLILFGATRVAAAFGREVVLPPPLPVLVILAVLRDHLLLSLLQVRRKRVVVAAVAEHRLGAVVVIVAVIVVIGTTGRQIVGHLRSHVLIESVRDGERRESFSVRVHIRRAGCDVAVMQIISELIVVFEFDHSCVTRRTSDEIRFVDRRRYLLCDVWSNRMMRLWWSRGRGWW